MRNYSTLGNVFFPTRNTLEYLDPSLLHFKALDINKICARQTMLCDQYRLAVALKIGQEL